MKVKAKEICIFDDKKIRAELIFPNSSSLENLVPNNKDFIDILKNLGFKDTGERISYLSDIAGIFEKRTYPLREMIKINCKGNCFSSFNDPEKQMVESRIITAPYCINSLSSNMDCEFSEDLINCEIPPKFREHIVSDSYTEEFDGVVSLSESVKFNENDEIEYYGLDLDYYPLADENRAYEVLKENRPRKEKIKQEILKTRQLMRNVISNKKNYNSIKNLHEKFKN